MKTPDQAWWAKARRARDQLEGLIMGDPNVRMISIGIDPEDRSDEPVLIVHLRQPAMRSPQIPSQIGDLAVRIVSGDYYAEVGEA